MGSQVEDQQVSCLWQGSHLLSVSVSGFINYLDVNNPDKPLRIIRVRLYIDSHYSVQRGFNSQAVCPLAIVVKNEK